MTRNYVIDEQAAAIYKHDRQRRVVQLCAPVKVNSPRSRRVAAMLPRLNLFDELLGSVGPQDTVVLVSKGPSLDTGRLRELRGRTWIMASLQTSEQLATAKIDADWFVCVDPQAVMWERWAKSVCPLDQAIFCDAMVDPRFWSDELLGGTLFGIPSVQLVGLMMQLAGMYVVPHVTYTVSEVMYALALAMGFSPDRIILNGIDYYYDEQIPDLPASKLQQQIEVDGSTKWTYIDYICGLLALFEMCGSNPQYLEHYTGDFKRTPLVVKRKRAPIISAFKRARRTAYQNRRRICPGIPASIPPALADLATELGARVE